jgi:hypothetical protein
MKIQKLFIYLLLILLPTLSFSQTEKFSADSAYAYIEQLSATIGPRPMGSQNERMALDWAAEKFKSFGADSASVMKFTKTKSVNTNSGIALGIFRGKIDSTIVIGGHSDSAGREIPGANDNASGTACTIELARVWSQRERHYTMMFATFGGEEQGLCGSKYFVDHYPDLEKVVLMLALDMAGSDDNIVTIFETDSVQAPKWLVKDAFTIDKALGINRLQYPTHFSSINNLGEQGAGSDHEPFLKKGIPAICFTNGINNSPIHTPQDKIDFIDKSMLDEYGQFTDGLITKYQNQGIPASEQNQYMLWRPMGKLLFIPKSLVIALNLVALALGIYAFIYSRNQRLRIEKPQRVRFSGLKLFLFIIVIVIFAQLGEALLQFIKGLRHPWLIHVIDYLWYAAIWAIGGVWIVLQITRNWQFSPDPYVYSKRALIILVIFFIPLLFVSMRLSLYFGIALAFISLAILIRAPWLKIIFSILAPLPILRLMFFEVFTFVARFSSLASLNIDNFGIAFLYSTLITVILILCYLPFIYSFSYLLIKVEPVKTAFKYLRKPAFGIIVLLIMLGYGSYLFALSSNNQKWRPLIQAKAKYDIFKKESKLEVIGNEYFHQIEVTTDSLQEHIDGAIHKIELPETFSANWISINGTETVKKNGEKDTVSIDWVMTSSQPWYRTWLSIEIDTLTISDVASDLAFSHKDDRITFSWFADPPETLHIAAQFLIARGAKIVRRATGIYPVMPIPITVTSDLANIIYRTEVVYSDTLIMSN